jgi:hypothetical protein
MMMFMGILDRHDAWTDRRKEWLMMREYRDLSTLGHERDTREVISLEDVARGRGDLEFHIFVILRRRISLENQDRNRFS